MKFHGIEMVGPLSFEKVDTLPTVTAEDIGRVLYSNEDGFLYYCTDKEGTPELIAIHNAEQKLGIIKEDMTLYVSDSSEDFLSFNDALTYLNNYLIASTATVKIILRAKDGDYNMDSISVNHINGDRISLVGSEKIDLVSRISEIGSNFIVLDGTQSIQDLKAGEIIGVGIDRSMLPASQAHPVNNCGCFKIASVDAGNYTIYLQDINDGDNPFGDMEPSLLSSYSFFMRYSYGNKHTIRFSDGNGIELKNGFKLGNIRGLRLIGGVAESGWEHSDVRHSEQYPLNTSLTSGILVDSNSHLHGSHSGGSGVIITNFDYGISCWKASVITGFWNTQIYDTRSHGISVFQSNLGVAEPFIGKVGGFFIYSYGSTVDAPYTLARGARGCGVFSGASSNVNIFRSIISSVNRSNGRYAGQGVAVNFSSTIQMDHSMVNQETTGNTCVVCARSSSVFMKNVFLYGADWNLMILWDSFAEIDYLVSKNSNVTAITISNNSNTTIDDLIVDNSNYGIKVMVGSTLHFLGAGGVTLQNLSIGIAGATNSNIIFNKDITFVNTGSWKIKLNTSSIGIFTFPKTIDDSNIILQENSYILNNANQNDYVM